MAHGAWRRPSDLRAAGIARQHRLVYEPLETLSYVAAVTERIRLGTSVIDALLHPPVVLARRFAPSTSSAVAG